MRWRSPNNPLPQIVLVASEATGISLCIAALANSTPHFSMDVPYLLLALPAAAAVIPGRIFRGTSGPWPLRYGLLALSSLLLMALGAGGLGAWNVPGSFVAIAFHPITVTGRVPSSTSTIAWLSAALVVLRGTWLGAVRSTFRQVGRSAAWTAIFFLTLFCFLATEKAHSLHRATSGAPVLFAIFFVEILAVGRVLRSREAAEVGDTGANPGERRAWSAILIVPLAIVVGGGIAAAAAVGAVGGGIATATVDTGHALGTAVRAMGEGVIYVIVHAIYGVAEGIGAIVRLFYRHPIPKGGGKAVHTTTTAPRATPTPKVPAIVGVFIVLALAIGLIILARLRPRAKRPPRVAAPVEVMSSYFTWKYLFTLAWRALKRLLRRLFAKLLPRRRRAVEGLETLTGTRAAYRRVLVAARDAGHGREASETAREFSRRVAPALGAEYPLLEELTERYELARYAGFADEGDGQEADVAGEALVLAFAALVEGGATATVGEPLPASS